ncbi:hypothetical protein HW555_004131 [Spodoptera exigua]|uniref:Uncharacterized protein n=1 Tax=Spodoptera exigua TaxID=7107 RepID=A0A835L6C7_SPOEX|nr:hypothetical protein HW555_004131 [Spodoptera exigua]
MKLVYMNVHNMLEYRPLLATTMTLFTYKPGTSSFELLRKQLQPSHNLLASHYDIPGKDNTLLLTKQLIYCNLLQESACNSVPCAPQPVHRPCCLLAARHDNLKIEINEQASLARRLICYTIRLCFIANASILQPNHFELIDVHKRLPLPVP